jgi:NAD(P)H-nitrite reductase large subunit
MNHVIIGNGPAGVIAAETIRKHAPGDGITLIGDEPDPPYSRMAIPYLLMGEIGEEGTWLRKDKHHFANLRIGLRTARVVAVNAKSNKVKLDSGELLTYDRLLIASGSVPNTPPITGIDSPHVHPCWTLADARNIVALAKPGAKVLQMGAGFIGCIIMEALAARGVDLTVVEMGNRMVPRMMTEEAGAMIKSWCEKKGISVFTNARVESIAPSGGKLSVKLSNGKTLKFDLVISATGVKPNIAFLKGSGIVCDQGIVVNERMESSIPGIFAAGDVSQSLDFSTGEKVVNAIQPIAADEARIAALNMVGKSVTSQGNLAMNVLDSVGLVASSFGQWSGVPKDQGGDHVEIKDEAAFKYLRLEFKDDLLVGATSLGHTDHVGAIRGLIQGRIKLGEWKQKLIDNPTLLMDAYLARAQAAS